MTPTEIADRIVPEYRRSNGTYYSCTGTVAKRWNAAYLAAELAITQKPVVIPQWIKHRHARCWDPDSEADALEFEQQEREVESFLAANGLTEVDVMSDWQPIETAPKDKTKVLVCKGSEGPIIAHQTGAGVWVHSFLDHTSKWKYLSDEDRPTHWQPLPKPPSQP